MRLFSTRSNDHRRDDDRGFSLIELLITATILPLVLSAAYLVFITLSGNYSSISAQSEATSEAQRVLDTMVRELRQAQEITDGGGAFQAATETTASFYTDLDRNGVPERITYYVDGTDLYRAEGHATTAVYPYHFVDGPAQRVVNLTTSTHAVFSYYDKDTPLVKTVGNAKLATVCAVGIDLTASRPAQNGQITVRFSTVVKIRALFNSLS